VDTDVVWSVKQRNELRRCFQLLYPGAPKSYLQEFSGIAARFDADMGRYRDEWTSFEYSSIPFVWREGRIAIRYRFHSPHRIVEIISVELVDDPRRKLHQSADSKLPPA
jgi:hypothetical protein